jgi:hypothetical protein
MGARASGETTFLLSNNSGEHDDHRMLVKGSGIPDVAGSLIASIAWKISLVETCLK